MKEKENIYCNNMSSVVIEMAMNLTNPIFPMAFPNRSVKILRQKLVLYITSS